MKFIDNILRGLGYERARNYRRSGPGFSAAQVTRLTADFTVSELSADSELRQDLKRLRARVRKSKNDDPHAKKFVAMARTNICGIKGLNFRNKAKDPDRIVNGQLVPGKLNLFANKAIQDAWKEWGKKKNCTVTRQWKWPDVQRLCVDTLMTDGEVLVRRVRGFDNPFRYALQLLESDHLDLDLSRPVDRNGHEIRMGVELNVWKEPVAYHLLRSNPNDNFFPSQAGQKYQRIPSSELIHIFLPRRIGQCRGYPPMATALTQLHMLAKYKEAELVAAREEACKGGWFKKTGETGYEGPKDADGNFVAEVEPGKWEELPYGLEPVQNDPKHPNGNVESFSKTTLRDIAGSLEHVSYNTLANDMESVNFASGKLGIDEERHGWLVLQCFLADYLCEPVFEPWLESAMLAGIITLPFSEFDKFNASCWTGRTWDAIDPEKEANASIKLLRAGLTSRPRLLAKQDIDLHEMDQEIKEGEDSAEAHEIELPELEPDTKALSIEEETLKFKQQAYLGFQRDGTVGDVLANLTDLSELSKEVGIPQEKSAEAEPWLPIIADNGQPVTGGVVKDSEGDIVGGEAEEPPEPEPKLTGGNGGNGG